MEDRWLKISRKKTVEVPEVQLVMGTCMETQKSIFREIILKKKSEFIKISRSDIGRERRLGCGDDAYYTIRMEKLEEGIGDSV